LELVVPTLTVVFASVGTTTAVLAFVSVIGAVGDDGAAVSVDDAPVEFKTETLPVRAGMAKSNALSIKTMAAPIVILDKTDCVPRGPKAVLETLLVKSAPASDLPGCSRTVTISTRQEIKNKRYKK
jgi:hypothetical protein